MGIRQQVFGIAARDLLARLGVEEDAIVTDRKDTSEFVGDDHNGRAQTVAQLEYQLVKQVLPGITVAETSELAKHLLNDDNRTVMGISPQKPGIRIPTDADLKGALTSAETVAVTAWTDTAATGTLMERPLSRAFSTASETCLARALSVCEEANITTKKANSRVMKSA